MNKLTTEEFLARLQRALLKVLPEEQVKKLRFKVYANFIYFELNEKIYKYAWYQHIYVSDNNGKSFKPTSFSEIWQEN